MAAHVRLWLDDSQPAPDGWTVVTTVDAARSLLESGVDEISLGDRLNAEHGHRTALVLWMIATGHWPKRKPEVHGARALEMRAMRLAIDAAWPIRERVAQLIKTVQQTRAAGMMDDVVHRLRRT